MSWIGSLCMVLLPYGLVSILPKRAARRPGPGCWPAWARFRPRVRPASRASALRSSTSRTPHSGFSARSVGSKRCVARRGVGAAALERTVDEQAAAVAQEAAGAGEQILRHRPRRNVQHVDAQHGGERPAAPLARPRPVRIGKIDALRRAQVRKPRLRAPGGDAGKMRVVEIARPPGQLRRAAGEFDGVLAGAAAEFQDVAALPRQKARQRRPDRLVIAVESRARPAGRRPRGGLPVLPKSTTNSTMVADRPRLSRRVP